MVKKYLPISVVVIAAFFAAIHLLLPGFVPTHDGEYHIIRFWQFDKVFRSGNLLPRWAPDLDHGKGVPIFAFFYPLPNYIAEVFILLGFSYVKSLFLVLASGLIVSGITFYLWARSLFNPWPSAVGAIFYILAPYHLVDVFIRGSVGEVWALAIIPLALYFTTELVKKKKGNNKKFFILNSITLLLSLLSHNILGPVFYLFGLLYGAVFNFFRKTRKFLPLLQSYTIGLMLSAFFWLPVIFGQKYVEGLNIVDVTNHFPQVYQLLIPSWGTGFSGVGFDGNQMSFQIGVPHLIVLLGGLFILFKGAARLRRTQSSRCAATRKTKYKNLLLFMVITAVGTLFLILNVSSFVWQNFQLMQYFQYPWRLLSVVIIIASWLAAYLAEYKAKIIAIGLIVFALLFYLPYTKPVVYKPRPDAFYLKNPTWSKGTATLGNSFKVRDYKGIRKAEKSGIGKAANSIPLLSLALLVIIYKKK